MPKPPSISSFVQWMRSSRPASPTACAIVLHATPPSHSPDLALSIATYLNEFDADGEGRWQAETPDDAAPPPHLTSLKSLAANGRVVLDSPLASAAATGLENIFHVGLGLPPDSMADCHIILNPTLFPSDRLPVIIGDVFLEWAASRSPLPLDFPSVRKIS